MIKHRFDNSKRYKNAIYEEVPKQTPRFDNMINRTFEKTHFNEVNSLNVRHCPSKTFIVITDKQV